MKTRIYLVKKDPDQIGEHIDWTDDRCGVYRVPPFSGRPGTFFHPSIGRTVR